MALPFARIRAAAILVLTYLLISLRQSVHCSLGRPATALLGAVLMLLFGVVGPGEALAAIDVNVIFLLRRT
ncbi:MAG: hypothetical protein A3K66_06645 [Euryarchaeota archaeon RBG_16_67_27]|nr:MAG: hypothetical protein A3K66_06645 [Euryarchaeota archaeon RBG_16_67_27]